MFAKERLDKITQLLTSEGKVVVKELSEMFQVSEDAIRKDLKVIENQGILERTYGGGILKKQIPRFVSMTERMNENIEAKKIIANKAFDLIAEGETIFLDISSTNMILAEKIVASNLKLTVISNAIDILHILSNSKDIEIISPGGILYQEVGGFVGSAAIEAISRYTVQKAFIASIGLDLVNKCVNTFNIEDGNTKKAIIKSGKQVILMMENKKFLYDGTYRFAGIEEIDTIITDKEPSDNIKSKLNKYEIRII